MKGIDDSHRFQKLAAREWVERNLPLILVMLTVFVLIVVIRSFRLPEPERHVTVGCVLVGGKTDGGWNESHYKGILGACDDNTDYPCVLVVRDNVPEEAEALFAAVDSLVDDGCNVVFLTSFGYGQYMDNVARKYPRVAFFGVSGKGEARNSTSYFARLYQVRYLTGIIAGYQSRTGVLGYVAAMPNPQSIRGINAYALGARLANPKARLIVRFTGSWDDESAERESVALLQQEGADVITYHTDKPYAIREAEKRGLMSIGYSGVYEEYSDRFLTAALYDWNVLYEVVLGDYLSGRANFSTAYWLGIEEDAVKLWPLSPLVSEKAAFILSMEKQRIMNDHSVFSGVIYDNQGTLRCEKGERIKDHELFTGMDWFAEGVEIYE